MKQDSIFYAESNSLMLDAFKKAQNTFKYFWRELAWERRRIVPGLDLAIIKVIFNQESSTDTPLAEYMWIGDIDFDGINIKGYLMNEPDVLTNIKKGDYVNITLERLTDWMFSTGNKVYGGFTVQLMRSEMDKKTRKQHDKAWGIDFGDPDKILLAYEQEKHPENLTEHPMCRNAKESFQGFLKQNPNELTVKDEFGYTLLHREVIAGNKAMVEILLEMGSDINAKTNTGHTALDFAKTMEWEHIIPILQK